jgi:hypothetical protein
VLYGREYTPTPGYTGYFWANGLEGRVGHICPEKMDELVLEENPGTENPGTDGTFPDFSPHSPDCFFSSIINFRSARLIRVW